MSEFNIEQELGYIRDTVSQIQKDLKQDYVTQDQFRPVQRIAWMILALIVSGAIGFVFYLGRGVG